MKKNTRLHQLGGDVKSKQKNGLVIRSRDLIT